MTNEEKVGIILRLAQDARDYPETRLPALDFMRAVLGVSSESNSVMAPPPIFITVNDLDVYLKEGKNAAVKRIRARHISSINDSKKALEEAVKLLELPIHAH